MNKNDIIQVDNVIFKCITPDEKFTAKSISDTGKALS